AHRAEGFLGPPDGEAGDVLAADRLRVPGAGGEDRALECREQTLTYVGDVARELAREEEGGLDLRFDLRLQGLRAGFLTNHVGALVDEAARVAGLYERLSHVLRVRRVRRRGV